MYVNSIFMNIGFMIVNGTLASALTTQSLASVFRPIVLSIAVNNGMAGITTSFFLKMFNSILKTFAGAIELLLTAVISRILFGVQIDIFMLISICLVSSAMYLYSTNPVINTGASPTSTDQRKPKPAVLRGQDESDDDVFVKNDGETGMHPSLGGKSDLLPVKNAGYNLI